MWSAVRLGRSPSTCPRKSLNRGNRWASQNKWPEDGVETPTLRMMITEPAMGNSYAHAILQVLYLPFTRQALGRMFSFITFLKHKKSDGLRVSAVKRKTTITPPSRRWNLVPAPGGPGGPRDWRLPSRPGTERGKQ